MSGLVEHYALVLNESACEVEVTDGKITKASKTMRSLWGPGLIGMDWNNFARWEPPTEQFYGAPPPGCEPAE